MIRYLLLFSLVTVVVVNASSPRHAGGCGCGGGCGGGCRAKARGVLRLEGLDSVDEDFGQIHGLSLWENPKPPLNVSMGQDPNFLFAVCCRERGLSPACSSKCNYKSYNEDLLQNMFIGVDECPLESLADIHFCAAQGRDHTQCCTDNGVTTVAAGEKCLAFCYQIPDKYTTIDFTYASCFEKFEMMKRCFYHGIRDKARGYFGRGIKSY